MLVSSISVGMKRSAMDIIMEISWAGNLKRVSGFISDSMASVSAMGEVVSVSTWEQSTSRIRRTAMNTAVRTPPLVMRMMPK